MYPITWTICFFNSRAIATSWIPLETSKSHKNEQLAYDLTACETLKMELNK